MDDGVVEFFGGPVDGQRIPAVAGGRIPYETRFVVVPARYRSVFDDEPSVPTEVHRYRRDGPAVDQVWLFRWAGRLE